MRLTRRQLKRLIREQLEPSYESKIVEILMSGEGNQAYELIYMLKAELDIRKLVDLIWERGHALRQKIDPTPGGHGDHPDPSAYYHNHFKTYKQFRTGVNELLNTAPFRRIGLDWGVKYREGKQASVEAMIVTLQNRLEDMPGPAPSYDAPGGGQAIG